MRAFELHAGEVVTSLGNIDNDFVFVRSFVDLDHISELREYSHEGRTSYYVIFSGYHSVNMTKPAFDRILLAWKSN